MFPNSLLLLLLPPLESRLSQPLYSFQKAEPQVLIVCGKTFLYLNLPPFYGSEKQHCTGDDVYDVFSQAFSRRHRSGAEYGSKAKQFYANKELIDEHNQEEKPHKYAS